MQTIVKVQAPLSGSGPLLIYDKERRYARASTRSEDYNTFFAAEGLDHLRKAFFHATLKDDAWTLGKQAEWQDW